MTVKIDEDSCIGCGICQTICPNCFSIKNGVAEVSKSNLQNCVLKEVCESCPCQAITVTEK